MKNILADTAMRTFFGTGDNPGPKEKPGAVSVRKGRRYKAATMSIILGYSNELPRSRCAVLGRHAGRRLNQTNDCRDLLPDVKTNSYG